MDAFLEVSWACLAGSTALGRGQRALGGWSLFLRSVSEAVFLDFWWILDGFGRPKWCRKSISGRFFSTLLSKTILALIWDRFFVDFSSLRRCFRRHFYAFFVIQATRRCVQFSSIFGT